MFHQSRIPLAKWFTAIYEMEESTADPSVRRLAKLVGVNKNTACLMAMKIRRARTKESGLLWAVREEVRNARKNTKS
jgi:hypothetical protein